MSAHEGVNACASAGSTPPSWESVESISDVTHPQLPFTESVGSNVQFSSESQNVDFFRHLLDNSLLELLVQETNRYSLNTQAAYIYFHIGQS